MTDVGLFHKLEGARAECERRMAEFAEGVPGGKLPREWFALNVMERRLRPLVYEAARLDGIGPIALTKVGE